MPIKLVTGNILRDNAEAIVIPVNTLGVAGAGLARQWALQYPNEHRLYDMVCKDKRFSIGKVLPIISTPKRLFLCFPTKIVPQKRSELVWIEDGLSDLKRLVSTLRIRSLALPALGCGLGGLDWKIVRPLIEAAFANSLATVRLYEPQ